MTLTKKTTAGLGWSSLERLCNQGLAFGIQILLARLIDPTEFGLLALLSIFLVFAQLIIDGGFSEAIVQKKELSPLDVSTAFYFNVTASLALYAVLFLSAPWIAGFYEEPRLTLLLRVLGVNVLIKSLGQIQNSLLVRNLDFQRLFKISTPSIVLGGIVGIVMALNGFEVWALVASQIVSVTISTVMFWVSSDSSLRPGWQFSFASLRALWRFGLGVLGASLLYQGVQNAYGLVIAKMFPMSQLAYYNRARSFQQLPSQTLTSVLNRVLFPTFSVIQDDNPRIVRALRRGIPIMALFLFPAMALLICNAREIVVILLTEKWLPAAEYLFWFPVVGAIYPWAAIVVSVVKAKGYGNLVFLTSLLKNGMALGILIFTLPHGVLAVVIGQVANAIAAHLLINVPMLSWIAGYSVRQQVADVAWLLLAASSAAAAAMATTSLFPMNGTWAPFLTKTAVFCFLYLAATAKSRPFKEIISKGLITANRMSSVRPKKASDLCSAESNRPSKTAKSALSKVYR